MNSFAKLWIPRFLSLVLAFVFWYAVKSDLGKNREFITDEWVTFVKEKNEKKIRLQNDGSD